MPSTTSAGMPGTDTEFAKLADGLKEDTKARKRQREKAGEEEAAEVAPEGEAQDAEGAEVAEAPFEQLDPPEDQNLDGGMNTERMEEAADEPLELGTLVGDTTAAIIEAFKHKPKPWNQMLGGEQKDMHTAIEYIAVTLIDRLTKLIAAANRPALKALFKGYSDKGGTIEGSLKFFDVPDDKILSLHRASGKEVMLVVADSMAFRGQRRAPDIQQDQAEMFEGDTRPEPPADDADLAE